MLLSNALSPAYADLRWPLPHVTQYEGAVMTEDATQPGPWRYVFFGAVGPAHSFLTMPQPFLINMKNEGAGLVCQLSITIERMQVIATVELEQEFEDVYTLRNVVQDATSVLTDCANFVTGQVYEIRIVSCYDVKRNQPIVFHPGAPALSRSPPGMSSNDISGLVDLAWREPDFQRALANFRSAMRYPGQTGFYCGRAVEALAHYFGPMINTTTIRETRIKLRKVLAISRTSDAKLIRAAASSRHGGGPWEGDTQRGELLCLVRDLMGRFVEFANRRQAGEHPLFPTEL